MLVEWSTVPHLVKVVELRIKLRSFTELKPETETSGTVCVFWAESGELSLDSRKAALPKGYDPLHHTITSVWTNESALDFNPFHQDYHFPKPEGGGVWGGGNLTIFSL